jgi:paraquat-inducible protein A
MSAPVVTGTVALMLQANPQLTPNEVKAILQYTSRPYPGYDDLTEGAGYVNAAGAVALAAYFADPDNLRYPASSEWGERIVWGNELLTGGRLRHDATAWATDVTWGDRLTIDGVLALTVAAAVAYLVAINAPLLSLSLRGGAQMATLPDAVITAWNDGQQIIAVIAGLTALLAPAAFILLRLYVLFPLSAGIKPPGFAWCVRALHQAGRWNMVEVLTVGVLLSLVRLAGLADASPGMGLVALGALTVLFAGIESAGLKQFWWQLQ